MIKIFNPIKSRRPWPPNSISHLFYKFLAAPFFTPEVFLFRSYLQDLIPNLAGIEY